MLSPETKRNEEGEVELTYISYYGLGSQHLPDSPSPQTFLQQLVPQQDPDAQRQLSSSIANEEMH